MSARLLRRLCVFLFALVPAWTLAGSGMNWDHAYAYRAQRSSVEQVLGDFARGHGLSLVLTQLRGSRPRRLDGWIRGDTAPAFLDKLALANDLRWFVFNRKLYVSASADDVVERLRLEGQSVAEARQALTGLGLFDPRFGWGELPEQGMILVSGPRRYVALVKTLLAKQPPDKEHAVMVFPLQHASAEDREVLLRGQRIVQPGVASLLRKLRQETDAGRSAGRPALLPSMLSLSGGSLLGPLAEMGGGVADLATLPLPRAEGESLRTPEAGARGGIGAPPRLRDDAKGVVADPRSNSVIVRDDPSRRARYEKLIAVLDVQQRLVEIESFIIEFEPRRMPEDLVLARRRDPNDPARQEAARRLLASLDDYESMGRLSVISRQTVVTPENLPAVIDLSYQTSGSGAPLSTGSMMRMTPRLVSSRGRLLVSLDIDIDQGNVADEASAGSVMKNVLITQAVIPDGSPMMVTSTTARRARTVTPDSSEPQVRVVRRERAIFVMPRVLAPY